MFKYIVTQKEAAEALASAANSDRYAIDTEFHREKTYYPQVALVQLAWEDQVVLIDPLVVDCAPFADLLRGDGLCILHAGVQDLEVLELACGEIPTHVFDTQLAAGFLGLSTASLASLLDRFMDVSLTKGDRLTDWLHRPLTGDQLAYAAADVDNLLELAQIIEKQLKDLGRVQWALDESALMRNKPTRRPPAEAINRIKEARSLKGKNRQVAVALATWRETKASEIDVPVRQVLSDLGVVALAQRQPNSQDDLKNLRGVDRRHLRGGASNELLEVVKQGQSQPVMTPPPKKGVGLPKHLRPVITLVTAWISQIARDNKIDPALLATRSDVEQFLRSEPTRLDSGWRSELVGDPVNKLISGEAAVAFDGDGRLVLETRSHTEIS